ncbi:MAG TPA: DUF1003 domain-containing protein [Actinomycetota bacterium]|nr:DUF1003 domain-containing protein [Actinomycetota bacterium]
MPRRGSTWTHPVLVRHAEERSGNLQDRIADAITGFAGSMPFVYLHVVWFTLWIALGVEDFPFGFLTMLVSLEAIFLSTFVMISQNRADDKRAALAEHQWQLVQEESKQNEELITISRQILELTKEIHSLTKGSTQPSPGSAGPPTQG